MIKSSDHVPDKDNYGRIFFDISAIKIPKKIKVSVTKPHWRIMLDKRIGLNFSYLFQADYDIIETTCVQISKCRQGLQPVRLTR